MRHEHAWARSWPRVVDSVRHVEILALKNAWRAEALDKRFRILAALEHHHTDDDGLCHTCRQPSPCPTYLALTTPTPWHRATQNQPVKLPIGLRDVYTAVTELGTAPAAAGDATKKIQPRHTR